MMHDVRVMMKERQREDFGRKVWIQSNGSSNASVISCPKGPRNTTGLT
jgi:hypothetical protein